jgi:hypothetical protein
MNDSLSEKPDNSNTYKNRLVWLKQNDIRCKMLIFFYGGIFLFIQNGMYENIWKIIFLVSWFAGVFFLHTAYLGYTFDLIDVEEEIKKNPELYNTAAKEHPGYAAFRTTYLLSMGILIFLLLSIFVSLFIPGSNKSNAPRAPIVNNYYNPPIHDTVEKIIYIQTPSSDSSSKRKK